jgi:hypothetical protein
MLPIWESGEKILIYFNDHNIVIYPESNIGFDKIFGRIHIVPNAQAELLFGFMSNYKCQSQQDDNAILISPIKISELLDGLKVLVELNYDGNFKLTQREMNDIVKKYLQIEGTQEDQSETIKYFVEIDTIFDPKKYPEEIVLKEISYEIEPIINEYFFHKFLDTFLIRGDDSVVIQFAQKGFEDDNDERLDIKEGKEEGEDQFFINFRSERIESRLEDKSIKYTLNENTELKKSYQARLTKDIFCKLWSFLRYQGTTRFGITDNHSVDVLYTFEKAKSLSLYLETTARDV